MKHIDLTPTWASLMPALIAILQHGTGQGATNAIEELMRLAAFADKINAEATAKETEATPKAD